MQYWDTYNLVCELFSEHWGKFCTVVVVLPSAK